MCNSRPYIAYVVGIISRFMSEPRSSYLLAVIRVMRYIKGTLNYGVLFPKNYQWSYYGANCLLRCILVWR